MFTQLAAQLPTVVTQAQQMHAFLAGCTDTADVQPLIDLAKTATGWIGACAGGVSAVFFGKACIEYTSAGGEGHKKTQATDGMKGSGIGLVGALSPWLIVNAIKNHIKCTDPAAFLKEDHFSALLHYDYAQPMHHVTTAITTLLS